MTARRALVQSRRDEEGDPPELTVKAVTRGRWPDLERLFESRGGPKSCWCMVWRSSPEASRRTDGRSRKAALKRRVDARVPIGLLGYVHGEPVAWCSVAPRSTYRPLGGLEDPSVDEKRVWSLVCFFVRRDLRGRGIGEQLLQAAIDRARKGGAKVLEAYPVDQDSPSYRFMGFVPSFEAAGFEEVGRAGKRRHVMRLELT